MGQYHRHPDGLIIIRSDEEIYADTIANFETDYGQAAPPLTEGMNEEFYEPGIRHFYANGTDAQPLSLVWVEGDLIIAALPVFLEIQARRVTMGEILLLSEVL